MDLEMIVGFISLQVASGFLKEHGNEIYHKVKGLLTDDELISLNLLEQYPESKELQDRFAGELKAHLETNPDIAEQLEGLIKKLPAFEKKQCQDSVADLKNTGAPVWRVLNDTQVYVSPMLIELNGRFNGGHC
jgi:hypothetical protein